VDENARCGAVPGALRQRAHPPAARSVPAGAESTRVLEHEPNSMGRELLRSHARVPVQPPKHRRVPRGVLWHVNQVRGVRTHVTCSLELLNSLLNSLDLLTSLEISLCKERRTKLFSTYILPTTERLPSGRTSLTGWRVNSRGRASVTWM
jgi:hypothetical protein